MRVHLSHSEFISLDTEYLSESKGEFKPNGLWYSMDGWWEAWCQEKMSNRKYRFKYALDIDMDGVLLIRSREDVLRLNEEYGVDLLANLRHIDWGKVKKDYGGIEVINQGFLKWQEGVMMSLWLSTWDVDGGCIWDLGAIRGVEEIKTIRGRNFL